jgi:phosphoribosylformylglycinamidine synthase
MSFSDVKQVRQGKYFDIEVNIEDEKKAKTKVEEMCKKLLANLVIEDYKIL